MLVCIGIRQQPSTERSTSCIEFFGQELPSFPYSLAIEPGGYGEGNMIERDGFTDLRVGPLSGAGFCLFLKRGRVPELLHAFRDVAVERVS